MTFVGSLDEGVEGVGAKAADMEVTLKGEGRQESVASDRLRRTYFAGSISIAQLPGGEPRNSASAIAVYRKTSIIPVHLRGAAPEPTTFSHRVTNAPD